MITEFLTQDRPIVMCKINGMDAPMLIDTGASQSFIDDDQLRSYKLKTGKELPLKVVGAGGQASSAYLIKTPYDITLEGLYIPQFACMNLSDVVDSIKRKTGIKIAGIIGTPAIKALEMSIRLNEGYIKLGY